MPGTLQWQRKGDGSVLTFLFPYGYPQQPWYGEGGPGVGIVTHPHPCWDQLQREVCPPVFGLGVGLGAELGRGIPGEGFQAGLSVEKG